MNLPFLLPLVLVMGAAVADPAAAETEAALQAADKAWPAWRTKTAKERAAILMKWFHLLHQHADDLARACLAALWRGRPQRVVHVNDDSQLKMGDYFDLAADRLGLPRAPRLSRAEAAAVLSPMQMSFLSESRRIGNARLKRELRLRLRYPLPELGW